MKCSRRPFFCACFIASSSSGCLNNSPFSIIRSSRVMSMYTTRPAPMFRCPTSLLPICPVGQSDKAPAGMHQRVGKLAQKFVVGWLTRQRNCIRFGGRSITPSIQDDEHQRFRSSHDRSKTPRLNMKHCAQAARYLDFSSVVFDLPSAPLAASAAGVFCLSNSAWKECNFRSSSSLYAASFCCTSFPPLSLAS